MNGGMGVSNCRNGLTMKHVSSDGHMDRINA